MIRFGVSCNFGNETFEEELVGLKCRALPMTPDFPEANTTRLEAIAVLDLTGCRRVFTSSLMRELLPGYLTTSWFARSLLHTGNTEIIETTTWRATLRENGEFH